MEIWKDIVWYEWRYKVSNKWNIKSISLFTWKEKILKERDSWRWYKRIWLSRNWSRKQCSIHRLVAQAFLWLDMDAQKDWHHWICVCHKNDIKHDNRVENLFIWTHRDNMIDCINKWRSWLKCMRPF